LLLQVQRTLLIRLLREVLYSLVHELAVPLVPVSAKYVPVLHQLLLL
jgi:hypothetical protein